MQSLLYLSIVTPTQRPHASDRNNSSAHDNPASVQPLSVVCKKPRVPVKITTAANRSKLPVSKARLEESDIVIAARSFRDSLGDNILAIILVAALVRSEAQSRFAHAVLPC